MNDFTLTFSEAIEKCLNEDMFIVGNNFKKGLYATNKNNVIVLKDYYGFSRELGEMPITKGLLEQKFKALSVINPKSFNE